MISFKSFVNAVHDAIMNASDSLMDKNEGLFHKYFEEAVVENNEPGSKNNEIKKALVPKTVTLDYPTITSSGEVMTAHIHVPLITLVPITASQIEKATLTVDFELEIVNEELQLHFMNASDNSSSRNAGSKKSKTNRGKLEIIITPKETTDGLKLVIEAYEAILKRQIS